MTARFMAETVPEPVPFEYNAQYFEKHFRQQIRHR